ncbi:MAG: Acylphosphatase [Chloroflexi bacterium ADurb.Bin325]|nr:MAG: Acylphosphatase [Chloroflexi bacterium ADurb.Bin325]
MEQKRVQVVIRGRVQGVGFRASCRREAQARGVTGWVSNRWDGAVEALFEGPAQAVNELLVWCYDGPPFAEVEDVQIVPAAEGEPQRSFRIR